VRRNETLKNGGEGIIVTERVGERERQPAHVRGGLTCPSILALSPLPSTVHFPSQSTLWIFGSPICVRVVVSFIRDLVV
jgi:hypothetical protein